MADELTMRELANLFEHKLSDTRDDIIDLKIRLDTALAQQREQFAHYVLSAVYEADKRTAAALNKASEKRMEQIERQNETHRADMAGHHRTNRLLFWTVGASILGSLVMVVATLLISKGGTH